MNKTVTKARLGNMESLIYDQVRSDILTGKLAPETPLSLLAIATASGTSRGPVREALRRLQQDQLVVARANKRFSVAPFNIVDLEAVLSLNLANDTFAIRISVPFATDKEIQHLERCAETMDKSLEQDDPRWVEAYHDFVATITKHSSPRAMALSRQLSDDIRRYRASIENAPTVWIRGPEFWQIIEAVRARDGALASIRYAEFAGRRSSLIMASVSTDYDAFRLRGYIAALVPADALAAAPARTRR